LYELGEARPYERIAFARFDLGWIKQGWVKGKMK
jgi:hypothetical protein